MIFVILFTLLLGLIAHQIIVHCGRFGRIMHSIPGPRAFPILGNMHNLCVSSCDLWHLLRNLNNQYYPIFRLWGFGEAFLNIRHPNDVETILGNPRSTQKSSVYKLLSAWFSTGLLTSSGRKWQTRRKILTPAFHFNVLQQFVDVFIEETERMIKTLRNDKGPVIKDLLPLVTEHTLNIICETSMGTSLKDKGTFQYKYRKAVHDMGQILVYRFVRPWLFYDFFFNLTPMGWKQTRLLKILHGFTKQIIGERKSSHDDTNNRYLSGFGDNLTQEGGNTDKTRKRRLAMLDLLIAAHREGRIDDEGIREEVDTFMFRGHDTTAMCICYTIMLLAEHKEAQERARAEVNQLLEQHEGKLTMSALQDLPYLDRCIRESLRLYPSVPFISRQPKTEVQLNNYTVPANTTIHVHIMDIHRDPRFWTNPNDFDPDRFLPENILGRHPYSYVPFSAGPRNCIGQKFAMLELKTTIGLLLHNFHLEPVDHLKDLSFIMDLVLRPAHPIRTRFIPIDNGDDSFN